MIDTVIPHLPERSEMLRRAVESVMTQTVSSRAIVVEDDERRGAAWACAEGLTQVNSEWVCFLGDDDWLMPQHHERLLACAQETGADVIYPWFHTMGREDVLVELEHVPFDAERLRSQSCIPGAGAIVRTALLRAVGCPQEDDPHYGSYVRVYEDWGRYLALLDAGAIFHHLDERLWCYNFHAAQTGGHPAVTV